MPGARIFLIAFPFRSYPCPSCSSKCAGLTVGLLGSGRDGSKEGEAGSCARGDGPRQKRRRRLCYRNQEQGCVKRQRWHCFPSWDTEPRLAFRPAGPKGKVMQHTRPACGLQSGSSTVTTPRRSSKSARLRTSKTFNSSMSYRFRFGYNKAEDEAKKGLLRVRLGICACSNCHAPKFNFGACQFDACWPAHGGGVPSCAAIGRTFCGIGDPALHGSLKVGEF